jgi:hypothetical protein
MNRSHRRQTRSLIMSKILKSFLATTTAVSCGLMMYGRAEEFRVPWVLPASMGWVSPMVDREGNTLLLGEYKHTPQFGDFTLPPLPAGNYSACLAKVDASGSPLWLRALAVSSLNGGVYPRMAALTEAGEIVFVGSFYGSVSMGGVTLSHQGELSSLIVKLRQDSQVVWARTFEAYTEATTIVIDPAGNIVVTGRDGGGGSGFLARFSDEGQLIWLRALPRAPGVISVDTVGNLYLGGGAPDGSQYGSLTLPARGESDAYVVKCDPDGNPVWLFGCGSEVTDSGWGLAVNREGVLLSRGKCRLWGVPATTVTAGNTTLQNVPSEFAFVVNLNPGGEPHAVVPFEGPSSFSASSGSVATDRHGNAVVLGRARLKPEESATTLQIGDKSLSVDATRLPKPGGSTTRLRTARSVLECGYASRGAVPLHRFGMVHH